MIDLRPFQRIPFVDKGRSFEGVDCWGLVWLIYRELWGVELPDYLDAYDTFKDHERIAEVFTQEQARARAVAGRERAAGPWTEITFSQVTPLCLVTWEIGKAPWHIGLCLGNWRTPPSFLHATEGTGVRITNFRDREWKDRPKAFFQHNEFRLAGE